MGAKPQGLEGIWFIQWCLWIPRSAPKVVGWNNDFSFTGAWSLHKQLPNHKSAKLKSIITNMSSASSPQLKNWKIPSLNCESLTFSQSELDVKEELKTAKENNASVRQDLSLITNELHQLPKELKKTKERADYLDDQSRRNNLRFSGVPADANETWEHTQIKIQRILRDKFNITAEIERAHRVGKREKNEPRDIVAKFLRFQQREYIHQNCRRLVGSNTFIYEDLCPASVDARKKQIDHLMAAREQGKLAYFSYRTLVIKEKSIKPKSTPNMTQPTSARHTPPRPWTHTQYLLDARLLRITSPWLARHQPPPVPPPPRVAGQRKPPATTTPPTLQMTSLRPPGQPTPEPCPREALTVLMTSKKHCPWKEPQDPSQPQTHRVHPRDECSEQESQQTSTRHTDSSGSTFKSVPTFSPCPTYLLLVFLTMNYSTS